MTEAYITVLTGNSYLPGALTLARALRDVGVTRPLSILVSNVSEQALSLLSEVYDDIIEVQPIVSTSLEQLNYLGRPDLVSTYTKIFVWKQSKYTKLIYLDADVLPLANLDALFATPIDKNTPIAASSDAGWPDIFNSGAFVTEPSKAIFEDLMKRIITEDNPSFDGGDQGLLNDYFLGKWRRLPFLFNVTPSAGYQYVPAFLRFSSDIKNIHFIGLNKPWHSRDSSFLTNGVQGKGQQILAGFHGLWWNVFNRYYFGKSAGEIFAISKVEPLVDNSSRGEGHLLNVPELKNQWDTEETKDLSDEGLVEPSPPLPPVLFPWENRRIEPERVFDCRTDFHV